MQGNATQWQASTQPGEGVNVSALPCERRRATDVGQLGPITSVPLIGRLLTPTHRERGYGLALRPRAAQLTMYYMA
jgi:hypothetical protein